MITRAALFKLIDNVSPVALQAFGSRAQMVKAIEEMSELTQVLAKRLNSSPVHDLAIIDEIADVLVVVNQMRLLFGSQAVDDRMEFKLNRTAKYILAMKQGAPIDASIKTHI